MSYLVQQFAKSDCGVTDGWESASISDDDEDGEWVDVHHSSDEDAGEMVRLTFVSFVMCGSLVLTSVLRL